MKITIAMDSFKGSLTSLEAGTAVKKGIERVDNKIDTHVFLLADGGEGTVDTFLYYEKGEKIFKKVMGPLGKEVDSFYGYIEEKKTAIIEVAAAVGFTLIEKKDPIHATSYGVGQLIFDALKRGAKDIYIGLGGSVSNDGGAGMLQALGFDLLTKEGTPIPLGAIGLESLDSISDTHIDNLLKDCRFHVLCDVKNPLLGKEGCSYVFGPQKGARPFEVKKMDTWLSHFADVTRGYISHADPLKAGAGAAGGIGFALFSYLHADYLSGSEFLLKKMNLEEEIQNADLVIIGEGKLDEQTLYGKAPIGVVKIAKKYGKPVFGFSGVIGKNIHALNENGITACFPIVSKISTLQEALDPKVASENLASMVEQVMRVYLFNR